MSLERIEVTPFPVVAGDVLLNRRSGLLTVAAGPLRRVLYWSQGELVMSASPDPSESLAAWFVRRHVVEESAAEQLLASDPRRAVTALHESGQLDHASRQSFMRDWLAKQFLPLFSLDEGTAAFTDEEPIPPDQRIFLPSTAALYLDGVRSIISGLVLRRSLGDLKRKIRRARDAAFTLASLPLSEAELSMAAALNDPTPIDTYVKSFGTHSNVAAKLVVAMLGLGVFEFAPVREELLDESETTHDLELLAAIGSSDQRSLKALGVARQLASMDHYQVIGIPRAATRSQIVIAAEALRKRYEPDSYPAAMADVIRQIRNAIDQAEDTLKDPSRRAPYDRLLSMPGAEAASIQQRLARRVIAEQNVIRAKELIAESDFYGAIVLLRQSVNFGPDMAEAWYLLGACQERNPRWRRDAAESFQMALSLDPNDIEAMIALGDLYRNEGLLSRAQTCYEDVLKINHEHAQAKSRLAALKKQR